MTMRVMTRGPAWVCLLVSNLIRDFIFLVKTAAVFTAAFFLHADEKSLLTTFTAGKVEIIDESKEKDKLVTDLEIGSEIFPSQVLATGKGSRVEISRATEIWRIGSMTVGKWIQPNKFWLHSGSILFCTTEKKDIVFSTIDCTTSFSGKGTIIIEATKNGGFKFIPLEGKGTITTERGDSMDIIGGRMLLVLGNPTYFGDAYDIDIMLLLKSSRLINAYPTPLPTFEKIGLAIYIQELKLKGKYDALIGDATTNENLQLWKFKKSEPKEGVDIKSKKGFFGKFFGSN